MRSPALRAQFEELVLNLFEISGYMSELNDVDFIVIFFNENNKDKDQMSVRLI